MAVATGIAEAVSSTAAGTVDVTDASFGGGTPVACILYSNVAATVASGLANATPGGMSIGFFDGTNYACMGWRHRHAQALTDNRMILNTTSLATLIRAAATTNIEHQVTAAFAANKVTLTKAIAQNGAANMVAALFGGTDTSAQVGTIAAANAIAGTVNITLPWVPSIGFLIVGNGAFDNTARNGTKLSLSVVTGVSNQNVVTLEAPHGVLPVDITERVGTGFIGRDFVSGQTHEITAWGTTTTIRTNTATGVRTFGYLFLKFNVGAVSAGIQTVPTATGNKAYTLSTPLNPSIVGMVGTLIRTIATNITDTDANALALGLLTPTAEHSLAMADVDAAAATTNTNSVYAAKSMRMEQTPGTDAANAVRVTMANPGPTLNWTTTPGTADRQMIMWAVGSTAATITADFTGTPLTIFTGQSVAFTDASTASGTTITTRAWTFGDGGTSTATNPSRTYAAAGTYTVTLTAGDGTISNVKTRTAYVVVTAVTVTASFTGTPVTGTAPFSVAFTDASTAAGTTITTRSWTFGDTGTSTATNPSHSYTAAGTYTVTLTVSNGTVSNTQTRTAYVVANAPPGGLRPILSDNGDGTNPLGARNLFLGMKEID